MAQIRPIRSQTKKALFELETRPSQHQVIQCYIKHTGYPYLQESTAHRANLNHCRHISFDVGLLQLAVRGVVDLALKVLGIECTRNQTFIDASGSSHQPEGNDGKPKPQVEDLFGLAQVLQAKDIDWLLWAGCHDGRFKKRVLLKRGGVLSISLL